jgi:hypothetical protein
MGLGFFNRSYKVTGQSVAEIGAQATGLQTSTTRGGTRKEKIFHARFVAFFKSCARKISPRKHTLLKAEPGTDRYLLARKGDPGKLRLDLAGRLRNPGYAAGPAAGRGSEARASIASAASSASARASLVSMEGAAEAANAEAANAEAAEPSTLERLDAIAGRGPNVQLVRERLDSGDPATQIQGRADAAALVADILSDFRMLSSASAQELPPERIAYAREQLTLQLIRLKLPEGARQLDADNTAPRLASEVEADDIRRILHDRYQYLPPKSSASETEAERKVRGDREWPTPAQTAAFVEQLGTLLSKLASAGGEADDTQAVDPRLVDRLLEQARLPGAVGITGLSPEITAYDSLYHARQLLSMLAQGPSSDNDAQIRRNVLASIAPPPEPPGKTLTPTEQAEYQHKFEIYQQTAAAMREANHAEVERRLPLARLQAYCEQVDRQFSKDATLDGPRLQLKMAAARNDGEREWIRRSHSLGLALRNLDRAWTIHTRHGGNDQSPFVQASRVRIDAKLFAALSSEPPGNALNQVQSANTRDVNLLVAHAISLQKQLDEQQAWLDAGESGVAEDISAQDDANQSLMALFDSRDLKAMGFSTTDIDTMERNGTLAGLMDAASALAAAGMRGAAGVARVNQLVTAARNRLIDNSLATRGLHELAGVEARAEALVAIARATESARTPLLASLAANIAPDTNVAQTREYDRAGAALARVHDERVAIDANVKAAQQTLKSLADRADPLVLNPADEKTREVALHVQEFERLASLYGSVSELKTKLEDTLRSESNPMDPAIRQQMAEDINIATGQLDELGVSLTASRLALRQRADHPLLAPHAQSFNQQTPIEIARRFRSEAGQDSGIGPMLDAAAAVVTVAVLPGRIRLCETQIREAARVQTRILEQRREALPAAQRGALLLELRSIAAGLYVDHLQAASAAGEPAPAFELTAYRDQFIAQAQARGIDSERFAIEIDDMLLRELDEESLGKWISDTRPTRTDRVLSAIGMGAAGAAARRAMPAPVAAANRDADSPSLANANRAVILGAIRQMDVGDRVYLKASRTGELGLSKLPADPSGTLKLDLMLGLGDRHVFDVKRKPNGNFAIAIREGTTLSARMGVSASPSALAKVAKLAAKTQLSATALEGCVLEFAPDKGMAFIEQILQNKPVDAALLATARDIRTVSKSENKMMVEASLGVSSDAIVKAVAGKSKDAAQVLKAGLTEKSEPLFSVLSLSVSSKIVWSRAWAEASQNNANVAVMKRSTAYQLEAAVGAELKADLPSLAENVVKPTIPASSGSDAVKASTKAESANPVGIKLSASRVYEAELAVEQHALDGGVRKVEFEFVIPLVENLNTAAIEGVDSRLRAQLERLSPERRAEFDQLLSKVDSTEGYALLATSQLDNAQRDALNAQYNRDREIARELGLAHSARSGDAALEQACKAHGERLAQLGNRAAEFSLQRLILVKNASVTQDQSLGLGFARVARQGQAGAGETVGEVNLTS